jgi:hypothetical protein
VTSTVRKRTQRICKSRGLANLLSLDQGFVKGLSIYYRAMYDLSALTYRLIGDGSRSMSR